MSNTNSKQHEHCHTITKRTKTDRKKISSIQNTAKKTNKNHLTKRVI